MYFIALLISAWRGRSCGVSIWPEIESQTKQDFFNDRTKTKDTNYRKLSLRKTKRVKKKKKKKGGDFQETAWLCTRGTPSGSKVCKAKRKPDVRRGTWNMVTKRNCRQEQKLNRTRYFRSDVKRVVGSLRK